MELIRRVEFEAARKIQFSREGSHLLVMSRDKIVSYDLDGTPEGAPIEPLIVFDAAYLSDTQIVVATAIPDRQYILAIYDIATQRMISSVKTDYILGVCVDQNRGRIFAASTNFETEYFIYDSNLKLQSQFKNDCMAFRIAISESGDRLAMGAIGFQVWDITGTPKRVSEDYPKENEDCTGTPCEANSIDITPDGRFAVAGFHGARGVCAVIESESGKVIGWYGPRGDEMDFYAARAVALSPDGKYVAVSFGGERTRVDPTVPIFNVSDGTIYRRYDVQFCGSAKFSPKGDILALGDANSVTLWRFEC
jgi:WD40 repeat protein